MIRDSASSSSTLSPPCGLLPAGSRGQAYRSGAIRPRLVCWIRNDSMSMFCWTSRGSSSRSAGSSRRKCRAKDVELFQVLSGERQHLREEQVQVHVIDELARKSSPSSESSSTKRWRAGSSTA